MVKQSKITTEQIHARASDSSFKRGENYYRDGAIFDTVKRGNEIEGYCEGSQAEPYHVRATLSANAIADASCTCEYDFGGDCKHIVALLLTYINQPEVFEERPFIEDTLAARDKDELIALIQLMLERYPDLQTLVDRPIPGKQSRRTPLDVTLFRKEIRHAIRSYDGWGDHRVENALHSIAKTVQQFGAKGDWHNASAICRAVLDECLQDPNELMLEDEGQSIGALMDVLEALNACLEHLVDDDPERQSILACFVSTFIANIEMGGYGLADEVPDYIVGHARTADLPALREQINTAKARKKRSGDYGRWGLQTYESLLIRLDTVDNTDPEAILARLREGGMYSLLIGKLIEMQRLDEAVSVVEKEIVHPAERLRELVRLVSAGCVEDAIRLAEQTLKKTYDDYMVEWLLDQLKARGDHQGYFQWQLRRIKSASYIRINYYASLKDASKVLGNWEDVRWELIAWLEKQKRYDVLTQFYLHDEDWEEAWKSLKRVDQPRTGWMYGGKSLEFEVAMKSRHALPAKALPVVVRSAKNAINRRSRDDYREAAEYLAIARDLYTQINDTDSWSKLIADIKDEFKNLPALQDELRKARL